MSNDPTEDQVFSVLDVLGDVFAMSRAEWGYPAVCLVSAHIRDFGVRESRESAAIAAFQYGTVEEALERMGGICFNRIYRRLK